MTNSPQIVRRTARHYTVLHLLMMAAAIVFIWKIFLPRDFLSASIYGVVAYLVYSFGSRSILLRYHRTGMKLSKLGSYKDAIREFELSHQFLTRHSWLDRFRFITMLDESAISYREMALCNIAYSYVQLQEPAQALRYYERAREEFPESELAQSGVKHVQSLLS